MTFLSQVPSTVPISHTVTYSCVFNNNWSAENHPVQYPSDAHWSPPVIVAHNDNYSMWAPGDLASGGVERVAETGGTSTLTREIRSAQGENFAGDYVKGGLTFNRSEQSQTFDDITLTPWFNMMSSITMVAPSPDWFTGFYNIKPIDETLNVWLQSFEVATYPWDAGTETGDEFDLGNRAETTHLPIQQFTKDTVPDNEIFLNQARTEVLPLAMWSCTLESNVCADNNAVCQPLGRERRAVRRLKRNKGKKAKRAKKSKSSSSASSKPEQCRESVDGQPLSTWCPSACGECGGEN